MNALIVMQNGRTRRKAEGFTRDDEMDGRRSALKISFPEVTPASVHVRILVPSDTSIATVLLPIRCLFGQSSRRRKR